MLTERYGYGSTLSTSSRATAPPHRPNGATKLLLKLVDVRCDDIFVSVPRQSWAHIQNT